MTTQVARLAQPPPTRNKPPSTSPIVWLDMELSGLDLHTDVILEIAIIVTSADLAVLETFHVVLHHDAVPRTEFAEAHHYALLQECRASTVTVQEAEQQLCALLDRHRRRDNDRIVLAGSSVHVDRAFLLAHMPSLEERVHFQVIDVSGLLQLAKRRYQYIYRWLPRNANIHRAMADVESSLALCRTFCDVMFRTPAELEQRLGLVWLPPMN